MGFAQGCRLNEDAGCTAVNLVGLAMEEGLLLVASDRSVVQCVPPLIVSEEDIDDALVIIEKAIAKRVGS